MKPNWLFLNRCNNSIKFTHGLVNGAGIGISKIADNKQYYLVSYRMVEMLTSRIINIEIINDSQKIRIYKQEIRSVTIFLWQAPSTSLFVYQEIPYLQKLFVTITCFWNPGPPLVTSNFPLSSDSHLVLVSKFWVSHLVAGISVH